MKTKKSIGWIAAVFLFAAVCLPVTAFAESGVTIVSPDATEEMMLSIAEELQEVLILKADHFEIYHVDEEIMEIGQQAKSCFAAGEPEYRFIKLPKDSLMEAVIPADAVDEMNVSHEELLQLLGGHFGDTMISIINSSNGVTFIAAASILQAGRPYVAELSEETLVILEYDGPISMVVDFFPSGEHVMTATATIISTDQISRIDEICDPDTGFPEIP